MKLFTKRATIISLSAALFLIIPLGIIGARQVVLNKNVSELRSSYPKLTDEEIAVVETVKNTRNSVVSILIRKEIFKPSERIVDLGNGLYITVPGELESNGKQVVGKGSGFVVDDRGLIATNKHVVQDAQAEYQVVFVNGRKLTATVVAIDPINDVALLKTKGTLPKSAKSLSLATDEVKIGQTVIAIGYALGELDNSITKGIISGVNRTIAAGDHVTGQTERLVKIIQTDAAINPGNSGGPLLSTAGEVIGMNTAVNLGAENIGFAIPADDIRFAIDSYDKNGRIVRPLLGIRYALIDEEIAQQKNLPYKRGALIVAGPNREAAVIANSTAGRAGIREGDIILEIDGLKIDKNRDIATLVRNFQVGGNIKLRVWRKAKNQEEVLDLRLEEMR